MSSCKQVLAKISMAIGLADGHLEVAKTPPPAYGCAWRLTAVSLIVSLSKTLTCKTIGGTPGGGTETRRMAAGRPWDMPSSAGCGRRQPSISLSACAGAMSFGTLDETRPPRNRLFDETCLPIGYCSDDTDSELTSIDTMISHRTIYPHLQS